MAARGLGKGLDALIPSASTEPKKGKAKLIYGKKELSLSSGQTFYLEGNRTHYIENRSDELVSILWVSTPPSF